MTQLIQTLAKDVSEKVQETILDNPDKVYFPNFGDGNNIFKEGITIDRVLFTIPGTDFKVYWYGFLIAMGILIAMFYGFSRMKKVGVDPDRATDVVIGGLVGAIFGARFYYILFNSETGFSEFFSFRSGGLAVYGGIIGGILVGGIIAKIRKIKFLALLDVAAPCFFIGQAIGRWGNFFNQETFGGNTDVPWGMMSSTTMNYIAENRDALSGTVSAYAPVHPCFLYESIWCIIGFVFLHFYLKHRKFDGEVFLIYTGFYGLGRFFIEATRTDSLYLANIKVSQLVAGASVLASIILIIVFRGIFKRRGDYKFFYQTELSKAQLSEYDNYQAISSEKKELKKKIKEAKASGESFIELEKEYDEKFGKNAKTKISESDKSSEEKVDSDEKKDEYKSILDDNEIDAEESEVVEKSEKTLKTEKSKNTDNSNFSGKKDKKSGGRKNNG